MADIDVIIPVRNGGRLLRRAVDSVLMQQGPRVQVVVVDDGSRDGATARLPRDPRLVVVSNQGVGLVDAIRRGISRGTAPFVARQDTDDESTPSMVRREVYGATGGVRAIPLAEDYDLWLRCAQVSGVSILPMVGYRYRLHAGMSSITGARRQSLAARWVQQAARHRLAGQPEPSPIIFADRGEPDPHVQFWWAREFAAFGSRTDALRCGYRAFRHLDNRERGRWISSLLRAPTSQAVWR